jgi:hypothetical protein
MGAGIFSKLLGSLEAVGEKILDLRKIGWQSEVSVA